MNKADDGPHGRESLSLRIKLCYGSGDLVAGLAFNVLNFFYLYFLNTVVGMPAYLAGLVLLIGRAWDAVMDPVMGMIVDSTTSKLGKHRFWMLAAIGPFVVFFALLWFRFPGNQSVQFVVYSLLFVLFSTSFTMYNIPYGSMTADLTRDYHERTSLTGVRMVFSLFAMIIGAGATQLLAGLPQVGYPGMAGVYGVVMLGGGLTAVAATRKRDTVVDKPEGIHFWIWLSAFRNTPFVLLVSSYLLLTVATTGVSGIFVYFVKYSLKLRGDFQSSLVMGVLVMAAIAALPLWAWVSKAASKKVSLFAGMAVFAVGLVCVSQIGLAAGKGIFYSLAIVSGIGLSSFFIVLWSMIPDVVEYGEMQTGRRNEGIYYGLWFFVQKLGMAASAAINGAVLSATGFAQAPGGAVLDQSLSAIRGINMLLAGLPLAFIAAGLAILTLYPINAAKHAEIKRTLAANQNQGIV
ncbi:MAG TPA: glycoside-pentoside-hexuronide (GPH):cation symporter [Chitinivibrionales bacterium]|jgi:GPH family glycoside/pentoside/hexuronide:cation symporter|nr:glycoside-pentoside-hexuronide (GPH):cation symporter [Chitinivibrionales bacterium]